MDFKSHLDGIVQQNEQLEDEPKVILIKLQSQTATLPWLPWLKFNKISPICGRQFHLFQTQVA